jgi:FkbM family methyltransferase
MSRIKFSFRRFSRFRENLRGWRTVRLDSRPIKVVPFYDEKFWSDVDSGFWEPQTLSLLRSQCGPGSKYCDIGAWVGPTVLHAANLGAQVVCFEPDPLAFERLRGNLRLNGALDVVALNFALGESTSLRKMGALVGSLGKSATSFLGDGAEQTIEAPCLSWNDAMRLLGQPRFDFIKIDIEGGEVELLPVMLDYLETHRPSLFISAHWHFLDQEMGQRLRELLCAVEEIIGGAIGLDGNVPAPTRIRATSSRALPHSIFFPNRR